MKQPQYPLIFKDQIKAETINAIAEITHKPTDSIQEAMVFGVDLELTKAQQLLLKEKYTQISIEYQGGKQ